MKTELSYSNVGSTKLKIPRLCFGATALGGMPDTYGYDVSEKQARETLLEIFKGPVSFLIPRETTDLEEVRNGLVRP